MTGYTFSQLIDFTRTSAATYVNSAGNIVSTPASVNLLTFTQEFANAAWAKTNTTITANSAAAPDGTMTADTLTAGAGAGSGQQIYQALTTIGAGSFVYSVYVKQGSGATDSNSFVVYNQTAPADYARITVNYSSGVVTQTVGTGATMTAVGNGWWRVVIPFTSTATLGNSIRFFVGSSGSVETPGEFIYAWGAQVESGSTASTYTRNFGGLFPARFDYDPVTLAPRGLLVEEQRTNLLLRSEEFDSVTWGKTLCTVVANDALSPDGTVDADKVTDNSTSGTEVSQAATVTSGATFAHSRFFKYINCRWVRLTIGDATNFVRGWFDIQNGVAGATMVGGVGTGAAISITNAGNGWYRCTLVGALTGLTSYDCLSMTADANSSTTRVSGGSYHVYGAQLEAGSFATSYIPTTASQVTRAADQAGINAPNFAPWYNQSEGTLLVEYSQTAAAAAAIKALAVTSDGTSNNRIYAYVGTTGLPNGLVTTGGVAQANPTNSAISSGVTVKTALAYKTDDFALVTNGGTVATDTSGSIPTVNRLEIGWFSASANYANGHIRSIRYYPTRLTNAQLQALSA